MNDTTHSCVNFKDPTRADPFWRLHSLKWSAVHAANTISERVPSAYTAINLSFISLDVCLHVRVVVPKATAALTLFVYAVMSQALHRRQLLLLCWRLYQSVQMIWLLTTSYESLASVLAGFCCVDRTLRHHLMLKPAVSKAWLLHILRNSVKMDYGRIFWSYPVLPAKGDKVFGFITHIVIPALNMQPVVTRLSSLGDRHALFLKSWNVQKRNYYLRLGSFQRWNALI
jgi:hypothetical protein